MAELSLGDVQLRDSVGLVGSAELFADVAHAGEETVLSCALEEVRFVAHTRSRRASFSFVFFISWIVACAAVDRKRT